MRTVKTLPCPKCGSNEVHVHASRNIKTGATRCEVFCYYCRFVRPFEKGTPDEIANKYNEEVKRN